MATNYESIMIGQAVREHDQVSNAKKVVSAPMLPLIDDLSTAGVMYVGHAVPGSSQSDAVWQIMKIDETGSPTSLVSGYADGNANFDNAWTDRLTKTYS